MPLCHPSRSETKTNHNSLVHFFKHFANILSQLTVFALSFNLFRGLSVTFVIGQSFYFILVFNTQLKSTLSQNLKEFITVGPCWPLSPGSPAVPLLPFIPTWPGSP